MYFNLQQFALPDFGLMLKADKEKLDGINSSTYLTTAAASETYLTQATASETYLTAATASETYATKAEMKLYIRQVLESDTGYVFLNGNSSEVGLIPSFSKAKPTLSADPSSVSKVGGIQTTTVTVTTNSSGAISAVLIYNGNTIQPADNITSQTNYTIEKFSISNNVITLSNKDPAIENFEATLRITVAETNDYAEATLDVPVSVTGM